MVKIDYPSEVFSEEYVMKAWNKVWNTDELKETGDEYEYFLRKDRGERINKYSHDNPVFLTAMHEDKIVGLCGWVAKDNFYVTAGTRVARPYRKGAEMNVEGIASTLLQKRLDKIGHKTIVAGANSANVPERIWLGFWEENGWISNPKDSQVTNLPEEVVDYHREKYGDNFLVWQPSAMAKAWNIIKGVDENMVMFFMED